MIKPKPFILIVDDDPAVCKSLGFFFKQKGFNPVLASNPKEAFDALPEFQFSCVILDMNFKIETTGEDGLKTLSKIKKDYPKLPVILFTGWGTMELAIEGMKRGASDFVSKPWENDHLLKTVNTAIELAKEKPQKQKFSKSSERKKLDLEYNFSKIIGQDSKLLEVLETVGRVAQTDAPILIMGESGTGKELIAEAIHLNSPRKANEFVKVNLGGISQSLFESEMFGHKKGAFTGAHTDRIGRFALADKGSIFLDEMGELDLSSQVKLLRVLQERKFEVLGSSKTEKADFRVISATNKVLPELVSEGKFREDLFFRINLITVYLPSLRERKEDVPLLAQHFLDQLSESYGIPSKGISEEAMNWLKNQPLKGNIRELKNWVESTVLMSKNETLEVEDFKTNPTYVNAFKDDELETEFLPEGFNLEQMEELMVKKALEAHDYKIAPAAKALGISRNALYRKIEKYNLSDA
ncbi:sigma-54-dependent transcriptional regulator [Sediminitomix flava]|uniref:DNA-binding NtrC family response regulator n=1 Tax=Sediminitomix flava TaxID=379075 RepID=A0A315Z648_SEDFL|nr:sigma-54 dependent transcriptional regulator [Sediminitomix flava]PWJ38450.1 DNA-binding NtrC family response regulator [Sediminitomix flava]